MITFEDVSAVYPGQLKPALNRVSVQIEKGEFVFLIGSSGSGKSTFMRLIRREQRATAGVVYVAGKELNSMRQWRIPEFRRQIGTVFQDFRLLPGKSAWENIAFAMQVVGRPTKEIRATVPEMIEMVGLTGLENRAPEEMSGGEQQRVAIARAVVNRPKILLADEPTGNLDPTTAVGIMRLLDQINRRSSTTVIMATHDANVVDQMRRRVIELVGGQIVRDQARGVYGSD